MTRITDLRVFDIRFPTSQSLDGSDAMNPDPDYSAAYVILMTDREGMEGHGLTFTIGRGNEICCAAISAMRHLVVGLDMDWVKADMGRFWRHITVRQPVAVDRPRQGRHSSGDGCSCQCRLGSLCQARGQAGLAAGRRYEPGGDSSGRSISAISPTASRRTKRWRC